MDDLTKKDIQKQALEALKSNTENRLIDYLAESVEKIPRYDPLPQITIIIRTAEKIIVELTNINLLLNQLEE